MNLSEKYRPRKWDDVVGQSEVKESLINVKPDSMNNLVFIGTNGIGKTSVARIVAKQVLGVDYPLQYKEYFRDDYPRLQYNLIPEIKGRIEYNWQKKLLIMFLDEFDGIDKQYHKFFSTLIDRYYKYIKFIFASNYEDETKIDKALRGRCEVLYFEPLDTDQITTHLSYISRRENITIPSDKLKSIALEADHDLRYAINQLTKYKWC